MTRTEINKLTKILHNACINKYGNKCLRCGSTKTISTSHIYPKGAYPNMRWDIENVKPLCYRCHIHFWHKSPIEAWEWLKTTLPKGRLNSLKNKVLDSNSVKLKPYYKYEDIKKKLEDAQW